MFFQTKLQNATKLKKILQDSRETVMESDVRGRMQPLKDQLTKTISHLHTIFETHVFIAICRGYWDRIGQVSSFSSGFFLPLMIKKSDWDTKLIMFWDTFF